MLTIAKYCPASKAFCLFISLYGYLAFTSIFAQTQNCRCDVTITQSGTYRSNGKVLPGQTVCIKAGKYSYLQFYDYVGTAAKPIKFINCGGKVIIDSPVYPSGLLFANSRHFVVSGFGGSLSQRLMYGIEVAQTAPGANAVTVANLSSDCEIEHIEVSGAGFAGITAKSDPTCDPATWQQNFQMRNVKVHDNYVHDVKGEGLYIGNSFWSQGMTRVCNGVTTTQFPHNIYGLEIYNNIIERTGAEGLQYACAPDALVHHNIVINSGLDPFAAFQNNGCQIGGGASGEFYNNMIVNSPATGIIIIGHYSTVKVYNNLVVNADIGVLCDDRQGSLPNVPMYFYNNTIINCQTAGFRLFNEINRNTVANNIIGKVKSNTYFTYYQGASAKLFKNCLTSNIDTLLFNNAASFDFRLKKRSPLINVGAAVEGIEEGFDLADEKRSKMPLLDVGAYEYVNRFPSLKPNSLFLLQSLLSSSSKRKAGVGSDDVQKNAVGPSIDYMDDSAPVFENNIPEGNGKRVKLYPVPATGSLTVESDEPIREVSVYDVTGRQVLTVTTQGQQKEIVINVGKLANGSYVVYVLHDGFTFRGKLIK